MQVRNAKEGDLDDIIRMSRQFYYTTGYSEFAEYGEADVRLIAMQMIDEGVFLIAEDESGPVGICGIFVIPFMFNSAVKSAHEAIWWVEPTAQGAGAGKALMAAVEPACRAKGVSAIQMMHLSTSPPQAGAIYESLGYRYSEKSYTKVLKWV